MDSLAVLRISVKWWFITLPVLAVFAVLAVQLAQAEKTEYFVTGSVIVLDPPAMSEDEVQDNPYTSSGGTGLLTTAIATDLLSRPSTAVPRGVELEVVQANNAPILTVTAQGTDIDVVQRTAQETLSLAQSRGIEIQAQAGASPGSQLTVLELVAADTPQRAVSSVRKTVAAVAVLGVVAAAGIAVMLEGIVRRRRERRAGSARREPPSLAGGHEDRAGLAGAPAGPPLTENEDARRRRSDAALSLEAGTADRRGW